MDDAKEIKEEENIKNENDNKNGSENTLSILEDKLPSKLIVIPVMGKPLFPGLYAPFPIPPIYLYPTIREMTEEFRPMIFIKSE